METPNPSYAIRERRLLRNGLENGFRILDCLWYLLQALLTSRQEASPAPPPQERMVQERKPQASGRSLGVHSGAIIYSYVC